jgi:hypothetical protein
MPAGRYNFVIEQGATFQLDLQYKDSNNTPINLTGYSGRLQIRQTTPSPAVLLCLSSSLRPDGTGISFSGSSGTNPPTSGSIGIFISAVTSSLLSFDQAVYDLEIESSNGFVIRLIEGNVKLSKEVTRGNC